MHFGLCTFRGEVHEANVFKLTCPSVNKQKVIINPSQSKQEVDTCIVMPYNMPTHTHRLILNGHIYPKYHTTRSFHRDVILCSGQFANLNSPVIKSIIGIQFCAQACMRNSKLLHKFLKSKIVLVTFLWYMVFLTCTSACNLLRFGHGKPGDYVKKKISKEVYI